jgi:hypothetical protein
MFFFFCFFGFLSHHDSTHSFCRCTTCSLAFTTLPSPSPLSYLLSDTSILIRSHLAILAKSRFAITRRSLLIDLLVFTIHILAIRFALSSSSDTYYHLGKILTVSAHL